MLLEFFKLLTSDAPMWARRQKLVQESIGILSRYGRVSTHWEHHLNECRSEIAQFLQNRSGNPRVAVFGSGHLLDFPEEILDDPSYELYLFDAVHPRKLRRRLPNAHFIFCDLNLPWRELLEIEEIKKCDTFISLNILSQLALHGVSETPEWRVMNHLEFLSHLSGPSLLISDFEKRFIDRAEKTIVSKTSVAGVFLGQASRSWKWDLAPFGEMSKDYRVELAVGSYRKLPAKF